LKTLSHNHLPDVEEKAQRLHAVAVNSFPVPPHMIEPLNLVLRSTLEHIRFLEQQLGDTVAAIEQAFAGVRELAWLMSIPGMGLILAACLLAELGPFDRFFDGTVTDPKTGHTRAKNARDAEASIAKWAGLWWPRHQSGTFEGEITRMAKDGNRYARYALIQLANCLREHSAEFAAYYDRKHAESKTHAHKRALAEGVRSQSDRFDCGIAAHGSDLSRAGTLSKRSVTPSSPQASSGLAHCHCSVSRERAPSRVHLTGLRGNGEHAPFVVAPDAD